MSLGCCSSPRDEGACASPCLGRNLRSGVSSFQSVPQAPGPPRQSTSALSGCPLLLLPPDEHVAPSRPRATGSFREMPGCPYRRDRSRSQTSAPNSPPKEGPALSTLPRNPKAPLSPVADAQLTLCARPRLALLVPGFRLCRAGGGPSGPYRVRGSLGNSEKETAAFLVLATEQQ